MDERSRLPRDPQRYRDNAENAGSGTRRLYIAMAIGWFVLGFGLLSFAGYQVLTRDSAGGAGDQWVFAKPLEDGPVAVAAAAGAPVPPLGDQPMRIVIDKIGVDAPVGAFGLDENAVPEVPYQGDLVAWYNFTAAPGTGENAVFAGHVTWNGDAVFKHLGELEPGDRIVIKGETSGEIIYRVTEKALVDPTFESAQTWMGKAGADVITVITCGGDRFETNDPVFGADYTKRQIIRAELVAVT